MFRSSVGGSTRGALIALGCAVTLAALTGPLRADRHETADTKAMTPAEAEKGDDQAAMMAEMMKYAMPAEAHARLEPMVGSWKAVSKSWMAPGQDPVVTEGTAETRLILGGRYLEMKYQGTAMDRPFEGFGLTGYDVRAGKYQSYWVDDMSTNMMLGSGTMDAAGKVLVISTEGPGPGGSTVTYRAETEIVDRNKHVYRMHMVAGDQEALIMEITYTRN